jgi:NAD(P)-dependent dehydrogenase (short-subunit alcohol dehydrogenase family)
VAEVLAERGYALALVDLEPAAGPGGDADVLSLVADVSSEADVETVAERVAERFGRADVLVNNAGISFITPAEETTGEQWRRVLDVNLTGPFLLSRAFGRAMLEARAGAIVNVASIAGLHAVADRAAYNSSKHGLIGLTRTLAAEWGGRGVRVNAVCPGWVKTPMDADDQAAGGYVDADIVDRVPMARFAAPDDIAEAVAFLADPARSAFINGVALPVDGGWTADASWDALRVGKR